MKLTIPMQEVLATIQRNQQQIDLLTANNTQLIGYLLEQGMIQNLADLPGLVRVGGTNAFRHFPPLQLKPSITFPPNQRTGSAGSRAVRAGRRRRVMVD